MKNYCKWCWKNEVSKKNEKCGECKEAFQTLKNHSVSSVTSVSEKEAEEYYYKMT